MKKKGRPLGSLMKRRRKGPVSAMRLALGEDADRMGLFLWWVVNHWRRGSDFLRVCGIWSAGGGTALEDRYLKSKGALK